MHSSKSFSLYTIFDNNTTFIKTKQLANIVLLSNIVYSIRMTSKSNCIASVRNGFFERQCIERCRLRSRLS
jgi:hypothetical protein